VVQSSRDLDHVYTRIDEHDSCTGRYARSIAETTEPGTASPTSTRGQAIRHFWGSELFYAPADPGQEPRHVGTIEPLWNLYDLTPEGRGTDWDEQLSY
jgi:predicted dithiol-disulfide oxidoreductase (DUF899 family)